MPLYRSTSFRSPLTRQSSRVTLSKSVDNRHRPQTSSFDVLPVELQIEIFFQCSPLFPKIDNATAPTLLCRVCHKWRSLILDTPKLWSAFEIEVSSPGTSQTVCNPQALDTMRLWLERSKSFPLSISLVDKPTGKAQDSRSTLLLAALMSEAHRWRHVQLIIPSKNIASLPLNFPQGLPALRSLTLHTNGLLGPVLSSFNIPWHQISYLDLRCEHKNIMTLDEFVNLLAATQRLNSCTVNLECLFDRTKIDIDRLTLPSLESLYVILQGGSVLSLHNSTTDKPDTHLVQFLSMLALPKIATFKLDWLVPGNDIRSCSPIGSDFMSFLRDINPTLRSLSLAYLPITEQQLLECFSQVTLLTHLDLRFAINDAERDPITEGLLNACTFPPPSSVASIMTALESLSIQCSGTHFGDSAMLELIESRRCVSTIQRSVLNAFHLMTMRGVDPETKHRIRKFKDDGMDISLQSLVVR